MSATEHSLETRDRVLDAVTEVQDSYIAGRPPGDVFEELLAHVLRITDSEYGYIGEVLEDDTGPYLKAYAMTDISWDEASRELYEQARLGGGFEFRRLETLFGAVLTTGEPVIANDAPNDPRAGGLMNNHLPLDRFLGLPLLSEGELVGSVGVANRPGGYDEELVRVLRPFLATCGNLVRAFRVKRELTAAEAEAERRELEFSAVVDAAGDGILTYETGSGRIRTANVASRELLDRDPVGTPVWEVAGGDSRTEARAAAESADGLPVELEVLDAEGHVRHVEASFTRTRGDAGLGVAVVRDVSDRVAARAVLVLAREEAERTSRAKDEFLAAMSHELRTPLNGVLGLAGLLASGQPGPLTEKQTEFVRLIERSGRHLLDVINDILDLAKVEADELTIDREPVDVCETVRGALDMVAAMPAAEGLELRADLPDPVHVLGDERRLRQVLLNLLSNAAKFTDSGSVTITVRALGDAVEVAVTDTGVGIPAELLDSIFDPFEQLDASLSRSFEGTGLGLSLARRLTELHGGTLSVASTVGAGSTFTVRLPVAAA